jgi:hypothetical protein
LLVEGIANKQVSCQAAKAELKHSVAAGFQPPVLWFCPPKELAGSASWDLTVYRGVPAPV